MLKLILIRHGETQGNKLKRYIGKRTDEPLCPEAGNMLAQLAYPEVQAVYASPMIRCTQTAGILFPGKKLNIIDELAECDFGEFENKNYQELDGNEHYQSWIDSGGLLPFPGGESREEFKRRNVTGRICIFITPGSHARISGPFSIIQDQFPPHNLCHSAHASHKKSGLRLHILP